jgi:hypothetical protein
MVGRQPVAIPVRESGELTAVPRPVAQVAAQVTRARLLWLLLLVLPVLPIAQLTEVWRLVGQGSPATYVATLHATVGVGWLVLTVTVGGMLRRRCRAAERRARVVLAVIGAHLSVGIGVGVAVTLGALLHGPPRWDAGGSVALFGVSVSLFVRLGWPRADLAWTRPAGTRRLRPRPAVLLSGILMVLSGTVLGHLGDAVLSYQSVHEWITDTGATSILALPGGVIGHAPLLPLLYGLLTAAGWLLICCSLRDRQSQVIGFGLAAAGVAWVAAITNPLNGDGLIFTWYGLLPAVLALTALAALVRLRRYRAGGAAGSRATTQTG